MNTDEARRRYETDAAFKQLVDSMVYLLHEQKVTAYDLRDAATFAVNIHLLRSVAGIPSGPRGA